MKKFFFLVRLSSLPYVFRLAFFFSLRPFYPGRVNFELCALLLCITPLVGVRYVHGAYRGLCHGGGGGRLKLFNVNSFRLRLRAWME